MTEIDRIRDQLKSSFEGEAWCGHSVMELLESLSAEQAASKLATNAHSIWELVAHLTVWLEESLERIQDRGRDQLTAEENFPPTLEPPDESAWRAQKESLRHAHDAWYAAMEAIDTDTLHRPQKEIYPSLYVILHGLVQHNMYHGGQIALLKKQL